MERLKPEILDSLSIRETIVGHRVMEPFVVFGDIEAFVDLEAFEDIQVIQGYWAFADQEKILELEALGDQRLFGE